MLLLYQPYLFNSFHGILYLMDTTLQHNISIFTYCEQLNQDINSLLYAKREKQQLLTSVVSLHWYNCPKTNSHILSIIIYYLQLTVSLN